MRVTPGTDLKAALKKRDRLDNMVMMEAGRYPALYVLDTPGLVFRCDGGIAVFPSFKAERCDNLSLIDIAGRDNPNGPGIMVVNSRILKVTDCQGTGNKGSGLLTANVSTVLIERGTYSFSKKDHGVYLSASGDDLKIIGVTSKGNFRTGIQVNADDEHEKPSDQRFDAKTVGLLISGGTLEANQVGGGGAGINLAGVTSGVIEGTTIRDHRGRNAIALWDDARNDAAYACHSVSIQGVWFDFGPGRVQYCVSIGKGCSGIDVGANRFPAMIPHIEDQGSQRAGAAHLGVLAAAHEEDTRARKVNRQGWKR